MTALDGLLPAQAEAAACTTGPVLVVAGPGSGKTRTLVARLLHLIESGAASPSELLAVTFTRKAAQELRTRLTAQLGPAGRQITVGTFHSVALILRPLPAGAALLGEADRRALGQKIVATMARELPRIRLGASAADALIDTVSRLKGQGGDWESKLDALTEPSWLAPSVRAYKTWQEALFAEDLDDLLLAATRALRDGSAARRFRFVQVDEYQDVNGAQRELLRALTATGASLFAIGDPDQAIYAFRGAEVAHFHAFPDDFPGTQRFFLRENFRSTATIVRAATSVITRNPDRLGADLAPHTPALGGEKLHLHPAPSATAEAIGVARLIEQLIGGTSLSSHDQGRSTAWAAGRFGFSDIAVLTRTAARADRIAEALAHEGVPILRPRREKTEACRAESLWSRLLENPELPPRERLARLAASIGAADASLASLLAATPAAEDLEETLAMPGLSHESDEWDARLQRVAVLTLHGAKGLEFPVVFLCGCEAELLPGRDPDARAIVEERRLFYVGLTRAKEMIYLSYLAERPRSPFLDELPGELLSVAAPRPKKARPPQLKLF